MGLHDGRTVVETGADTPGKRLPCKVCHGLDFLEGNRLHRDGSGSRSRLEPSSLYVPWGARLATNFDCPSYSYLVEVTGEVVQVAGQRCKRNDCFPCASWKSWSIELAMHLAQPQWLVTLGPISCPLSKLSQQVSRYRQRLRRSTSSTLQDAYFVEPYAYRSGYHLHSYAWGAELTAELVAPAAISSGLADAAHVHVQRISHHANLGYGMKMISHPTDPDDRQRFLEANSGRLVHASHGFWRGPANHPAGGGYRGSLRRAREGVSNPPAADVAATSWSEATVAAA